MEAKILIIVSLCFTFASAQFPINGTCPNFSDCRDNSIVLTQEKLAGIWYLASSIPYFYEMNMKCTYFNFTALSQPNAMHFEKIEFNVLTDVERKTNGVFNFTTDGIMDYTYTDLLLPFRFDTLEFTSEHHVFASCHACDFFESAPGIYAYILTRIAFPGCEIEEASIAALRKCGISKDVLVTHDQSNCTICRYWSYLRLFARWHQLLQSIFTSDRESLS